LVRTGLTEEVIQQLGDYQNSDLPKSWIAALKLTDHVSGNSSGVLPAAVYSELLEHFSEPQILRLGSLLAVGSGWQRMIETFGIRPDHYVESANEPWAS
jgi:alkylhydroperoxidase family enzyme